MLKRLERMQKLVELAQDDLEKASLLLKGIQQQIAIQQEQLSSLKGYKADYVQRLTRQEATTLQQLNITQAFLDKLNIAIVQQTEEMERLSEAANNAEEAWRDFKSREQSLVKLYEKIKKNHNAKLEKMEQRMLDDLSGRQFFLNNQNED